MRSKENPNLKTQTDTRGFLHSGSEMRISNCQLRGFDEIAIWLLGFQAEFSGFGCVGQGIRGEGIGGMIFVHAKVDF